MRRQIVNLGNCPAVDIKSNVCMLDGQEVACNLIRECDQLTGAVHFEYALPEATNNPNIWVAQADGGWEWSGPNKPNVPPPTLPKTVQPVFVPDPIPVHTPPNTTATSTAKTLTHEAKSPSGTWNFQNSPGTIVPNLSPPGGGGGSTSTNKTQTKAGEENTGTLFDDLTTVFTKPVGKTSIPWWLLIVAGGVLLISARSK